MAAPQELADTLVTLTPPEYVRFMADWMVRAGALEQARGLTGVPKTSGCWLRSAASGPLRRSVSLTDEVIGGRQPLLPKVQFLIQEMFPSRS